MKVVFRISFLALSKVKVNCAEKELTWKTYIIAKALPTTKKIQIIGPKIFAKVALDQKQEAFVIHIITLFIEPMKVQLNRKVQIAILIANKVFVIILAKYSDFENMFFI